MSIIATLKLHEGIIVGADSSCHVYQTIPNVGPSLVKIYEGGQRIYRVKDLKIVILTYGAGNIGARSIASYIQEFSRTKGANYNESIVVQDVAQTLFYMIKEKYDQFYGAVVMKERPELGFMIMGYSKNDLVPQEFEFSFPHDLGIKRVKEQHFFGLEWRGNTLPYERLHRGYDRNMVHELIQNFNLSKPEVDEVIARFEPTVYYGGLTLSEGVGLLKHVLHTTINYEKLNTGYPQSLAPINMAVITKEKYWEIDPAEFAI